MASSWKRNSVRSKRGLVRKQAPWRLWVWAVLLVALTLGQGLFHGAAFWNTSLDRLTASTGKSFAFAHLPEVPFRLGLDLQGGAHLVYAADMSSIPAADRVEALQGVRDVIERRVNAFGVSEPVVQTVEDRGRYEVVVDLAGVQDVSEAVRQIGETPILEFKEQNTAPQRDLTDNERTLLADAQAEQRANAAAMLRRVRAGEDLQPLINQFRGSSITRAVTPEHPLYGTLVQTVLDRRLSPGQVLPTVFEDENGLHVLKYVEQVESATMDLAHILVCYKGATGCTSSLSELDASLRAESLRGRLTPENFAEIAREESSDTVTGQNGGDLGSVLPGQTVSAFEAQALLTEPGTLSQVVETEFGFHIIYVKSKEPTTAYRIGDIVLPLTTEQDLLPAQDQWKNTALSGKNLKRSTVQFDPNSGAPVVSLQFDDEGARLFGEITAAHINQPIAIFLDGSPISIPVVQQAIYGGEAVITGDFSIAEAKLLAQRLNAGALPVSVSLLNQQTVGPTLGQSSLNQSLKAALAGLIFVGVFMLFVYRLPGLLAVFALLLYIVLNLTAYKVFGVTMTLAGIAGFVLSLGIAVDANVLIFERLKDELRNGRDLATAIQEGFTRAWPAIRDGNLTTLIATAVMYGFSASFVRGFALTLMIGVLLSMFSAVAVTHSYLRLAHRFAFLRRLPFYGISSKS